MDGLNGLKRLSISEEHTGHGAVGSHSNPIEDFIAFVQQRLGDTDEGSVQITRAQFFGESRRDDEFGFILDPAGEGHGIEVGN